MAKEDYYKLLGVERDSSSDQIKSAYRKMALKYHPDRNPDDKAAEEHFRGVSEAYEVLSDSQKKAAYDQYGHAGVEGSFGQGGFQWGDFSRAGDFEDIFGDLFGSFFGGGRRRQRGPSGPPKGRDLKLKVSLTLEEIATGVKKEINLNRLQRCETCSGSGAASGSQKTTCSTCGGVGQVQQVARSLFGQTVSVTACPTCEGAGSVIRDPCPACDGDGRVRGTTTLTVTIPAGVSEGHYIPLRGQGESGPRGGPPGDSLVFIEEQEHEYFQRDGNDILYRLPVSFSQATLGDELEVPTLSGKVRMKVPPGTQSGRIFRLRHKGIPDVDGRGMGDQLVEIVLVTPARLSTRETGIFQELSELEKNQAKSEGKSFFEKMWEAFTD
jgi:molecular chaperone DnaJ